MSHNMCANSPRVQWKIHATYKCKVKVRKVKVPEWSALGNIAMIFLCNVKHIAGQN